MAIVGRSARGDAPVSAIPFVGYAKLRAGRIHIFCPRCHRKMSNVARDKNDPPNAALIHVWCGEPCGSGGWIEGPTAYLDANGRFLDWGAWFEAGATGNAPAERRRGTLP